MGQSVEGKGTVRGRDRQSEQGLWGREKGLSKQQGTGCWREGTVKAEGEAVQTVKGETWDGRRYRRTGRKTRLWKRAKDGRVYQEEVSFGE